MIVVLLVAMAATAISGWLLTTDAYWGSTMKSVHSAFATGVLALVVLHLSGSPSRACAITKIWSGRWCSGVKRAARSEDVA